MNFMERQKRQEDILINSAKNRGFCETSLCSQPHSDCMAGFEVLTARRVRDKRKAMLYGMVLPMQLNRRLREIYESAACMQ
jgi:hypothetical protein